MKKKTDKKPSSGLKKVRTAMRKIGELSKKVKRWNRYAEEVRQHRRKGDVSRWNTAGLEKHILFLEHVK